jgi:hypothetical protein
LKWSRIRPDHRTCAITSAVSSPLILGVASS